MKGGTVERWVLLGAALAVIVAAFFVGGCGKFWGNPDMPCPGYPSPCVDLPPTVVAEATCEGALVRISAVGSQDADSCGDRGIVRMDVVNVCTGQVLYSGSSLTTTIQGGSCNTVFVTVLDNEGTANTVVLTIPSCQGPVVPPVDPCLPSPPPAPPVNPCPPAPPPAPPVDPCPPAPPPAPPVDPCPPPCVDLPPTVVAEATCEGALVRISAVGSQDADSCGDRGIVRMDVVNVCTGQVLYSGSSLTTTIQGGSCNTVFVTVWDNEETADTVVLTVPSCQGPVVPPPCLDLSPEIVATLTYDCQTRMVRVDARASHDRDSCGDSGIVWMSLVMQPSGTMVEGSQLVREVQVPAGVSNGTIRITIRDNEGTEAFATAQFIITGSGASFAEVP